jgi:hypothetical protein
MLSLFLSLAGLVVLLGVPIALILWVVRIVRHQQAAPLTAHELRAGLLSVAISVVSTVFLILLSNQLAPDYPGNFALGLALAAVTFGTGLTVRRIPAVGTSLLVSSLALTSYAFGRHGQAFDVGTKAVLSLLGLSLVTGLTYWGRHLDERNRVGPARLTTFRQVLIALFVALLALLTTSFVSDLTSTAAAVSTDTPFALGPNELIVVLVSGLTWLSIGSTARRVPALSIGFAVAGAFAFLSSLAFIVATVKGFGPVVVTGLILAGLLTLAYRLLQPTKGA